MHKVCFLFYTVYPFEMLDDLSSGDNMSLAAITLGLKEIREVKQV